MQLSCIRIEAYCRHSFPAASGVSESPPWLSSYYQGLLSQFGMDVDQSALESRKSNDFLTMSSHVLQTLSSNSKLDDIGLFLMAHQTLDTFHPFRSVTTLLCRKFGIEAPAVALTEQELTSPYIALTILLAALRQESFRGTGLLLVLDQTTLPHKRQLGTMQDIDTAIAIKLAAAPEGAGASLKGRHYWTEEGANKPRWVMQCIYSFLDLNRVDLAHVQVVADRNLVEILTADIPPAQLTCTDPRLMSCAGLVAAMDLLNSSTTNVLLTHQAEDGHLYLFLFGANKVSSTNGNASCFI